MALKGFNHKMDSLSIRQLQVMQGLALGVKYVEIGKILDISPKTVEEHRRRAYAKLRCHTAHEAQRWLVRQGLMIDEKEWKRSILGENIEEIQVQNETDQEYTKGVQKMWAAMLKRRDRPFTIGA